MTTLETAKPNPLAHMGTRPLPDDAPSIKAQHMTLIGRRQGVLVWATGAMDKRLLVAEARGELYVAWTGRYSTHIFSVDRDRVKRDL